LKSILDKEERNELIVRIQKLDKNSKALWGKMNIHQMIKHCILCEEMYLGKTKYKRNFIGLLLGKLFLRNLIKNDNPKKRNSPTKSEFKNLEIISNINSEKEKWIGLINEYETLPENNFVHWFYGKMTKEQIGFVVYKHIDHHLRQFNA